MPQDAKFTSRLGVIAATVGSAVGLGNIWRFPAEVQSNGGAVFLAVYVVCIVVFGIPVMTSEFALGHGTGANAVDAFSAVTPRRRGWRGVGLLGVASAYAILSFYMVVAGWTLEYLWQSVTGGLYQPVGAGMSEEAQFGARMSEYVEGTWRPLVMTWLMLAGNLGVLLLGVQKGIEKMANTLMPLLFALLLLFCVVALTLPGAGEGLKFFLAPDFDKLTPATFINALGQSFFSLSLGMGALVTYASYFPRGTRLVRTAVTVSALDLLVALLMGFIIFPAVMTFGLADHQLAGQALVFITLPEIFARMGGTQFWSILFFLLLLVAAFTSTISLAEVATAYIQERWRTSRRVAACAVVIPLVLFSSATSLSLGVLSGHTLMGMTLFGFLDSVTTNVMLPVGSLLLCIYMGWVAPDRFFRSQVGGGWVYRALRLVVRYVAPVLIALIMAWNIVG